MSSRKRTPITIATVLIVVTILAIAGFSIEPSNAQKRNNPSKKPSSGLTITKSDHLGPQNVVKTRTLSFDKTLNDAMGKGRRIQIDKVDYLKTPGIRYHVKVDGESREISYLDLKSAKVRLVNIEGTDRSHNFVHILSAATNTDSYRTENVVLEETIHIEGKRHATPFSLPRSKTDELSFALRTIDPIHVVGLKPEELFSDEGGTRPADPVKPPDWGGIFPPIEILFKCKINSKNLKRCEEGCDIQQPAEDQTWGNVGISARNLCKQQSGCLWCAGVCCKSSACSSETNPEPIFDCELRAGS